MEPTIYLFFKGNCLEAMTHYAEVLGGEIVGVFRNADAPDPASRMPGGDDLVMNLSMKLGAATGDGFRQPGEHVRQTSGISRFDLATVA
jgi:PhnB protein